MSKHTKNGFSSMEFLIILFFLCIISLGTMSILRTVILYVSKEKNMLEIKKNMTSISDLMIKDLKDDHTPQSDSKQDIFWKWNGTEKNGYTISIVSLSSKLNPNYITQKLIEKTTLKKHLIEGKTAATFINYREHNGLLFSNRDFLPFFTETFFQHCFSVYNWANINLIDASAGRKLVTAQTGLSSQGDYFYACVQNLLVEKKMLQDDTELQSFMPELYTTIYPFITTAPSMNIHFVDPELLETIIAYPEFSITSPADKARKLETMRESKELTQADIASVLNINANNRLYYYFGTITWFWQITIQNKTHTYTVILCRYPPRNNLETKAQFSIIEKRFL